MRNTIAILVVALVAVSAITGIEFYALSKGIDGVALAAAISAIAGIGGWLIPSPWRKKGG
jgi:hypothetical protein